MLGALGPDVRTSSVSGFEHLSSFEEGAPPMYVCVRLIGRKKPAPNALYMPPGARLDVGAQTTHHKEVDSLMGIYRKKP